MYIRLARDVRIAAEDGRCFTLQSRHVSTKDPGKVTWKNRGYYAGVAEAATRAIEIQLIGVDKDVKKVLKLIEAITIARDRIIAACEGAFNASEAVKLEGETGDEGDVDLYPSDFFEEESA